MDNKEEMIEDISVDTKPVENLTEEASVNEESLMAEPELPKEEVIEDSTVVSELVTEPVIVAEPTVAGDAVEIIEPVKEGEVLLNTEYETVNNTTLEETPEGNIPVVIPKSKSKKIIIIILSILLVLDLAALIIYLIGIDKVLGFVK